MTDFSTGLHLGRQGGFQRMITSVEKLKCVRVHRSAFSLCLPIWKEKKEKKKKEEKKEENVGGVCGWRVGVGEVGGEVGEGGGV